MSWLRSDAGSKKKAMFATKRGRWKRPGARGAGDKKKTTKGRRLLREKRENENVLFSKKNGGKKVKSTSEQDRIEGLAALGKAEELDALLKTGLSPNVLGDYGWTPLCIAVAGGHVEAMRVIVRHGGDVNLPMEGKRTPLMMAAAWNKKEAVQFLLSMNANVLAVDEAGRTAEDYARMNEGGVLTELMHAKGEANLIEETLDKKEKRACRRI